MTGSRSGVGYLDIWTDLSCVQAVSLQTVEVPAIVKETEVLIEVRAASLDPVDLKVME